MPCLKQRADSNVRSLPSTQLPAVGHTEQGLTPLELELAVGDERLVGLLTDFCSTQEDVRTSAFDIWLTGVRKGCGSMTAIGAHLVCFILQLRKYLAQWIPGGGWQPLSPGGVVVLESCV